MSVRPTSFLCTNFSYSLTNGKTENSPIEHIKTPHEEHTDLLQIVKQLSKGIAILVMVTSTNIGPQCKQDTMLRFVGFHHSSTEHLNYKEAQLKESSNTDLYYICHLKITLAGVSAIKILACKITFWLNKLLPMEAQVTA